VETVALAAGAGATGTWVGAAGVAGWGGPGATGAVEGGIHMSLSTCSRSEQLCLNCLDA